MVSAVVSSSVPSITVPDSRAVRSSSHGGPPINVGSLERTASVMLGSLLVAKGIKRLSLLGMAMAAAGAALIERGATGQCRVYKALGVRAQSPAGVPILSNPLNQRIRVEKSITVNKPVSEVYSFWRNLENLPRFMHHLASVKLVNTTRSIWTAKAPPAFRGKTVQWNADIVAEEPNRKIAWKSVEGADVPNAGHVLFKALSDGSGTQVQVVLSYDPPAGVLGALFARLFGEEPSQTIEEDLHRFKQLLEDVPPEPR